MSKSILNILCFEKKSTISKIAGAVFNSVPKNIDRSSSLNKFIKLVAEKKYHIVLVDYEFSGHLRSPDESLITQLMDTHLILILKNLPRKDDLIQHPYRYVVTEDSLSSKLPVLLGDVYHSLQEKQLDRISDIEVLRESISALENFVAIVDHDADILFLNRAAESLLKITGEIYTETSLLDYFVDGEKIWKYFIEILSDPGGSVRDYQLRFRDAGNHEIEGFVTVAPIKTAETLYLLSSNKPADVKVPELISTEHKILEKFADSIANELINPVNIMSGRLQLLKTEKADQTQMDKNIDTMNSQLYRINDIITKLTSFARLKQDTIPQKININDILQNLLLAPDVIKAEKMLNFRFDKNIPALAGQISHFEILMKTLVGLGIKYLKSDGKLEVVTEFQKMSSGEDRIGLHIRLKYEEEIINKEMTFCSFFGTDSSGAKTKSIDLTVIEHILNHYNSRIKTEQIDKSTEILTILFPVPGNIHAEV
ncbi:MAG: histidine kinase dimerization/phospho-acceptor domain-containing protein [Calditrichaceae bacterium]